MRHETQPWPELRATLEIIFGGTPRTGSSTAQASIFRISDGLFWNGSSGNWQSTIFLNGMTEVTAVPGTYEYVVPPSVVDFAASKAGYYIRVGDSANNVLETILVHPAVQPWQEQISSYNATGTFGAGVRVAQVNGGAIGSVSFLSGAINAAAIDTNAITDAKINNGAITDAKIATGAITARSSPPGPLTRTLSPRTLLTRTLSPRTRWVLWNGNWGGARDRGRDSGRAHGRPHDGRHAGRLHHPYAGPSAAEQPRQVHGMERSRCPSRSHRLYLFVEV